jgi:class 3 adenylate cyclase
VKPQAAETVHSVEGERMLPAASPLVWALVADSNRWDRALGAKPTRYTYEPVDEVRTRLGHSRQMGLDVTFVETGEWVEGNYMWGERQFVGGPFQKVGYRCWVEPAGQAARVRAEMYFTTDNELAAALAPGMKTAFKAGLDNYLAALEALIARAPGVEAVEQDPPVTLARRLLLTCAPDKLTSGPTSTTRDDELEVRAGRLGHQPVDPAVAARVVALLRERPDDDLRQMRPFELARAWGLPRREVLRAFLYAARVGLVDLHWQLNCPTCKVGSDHAPSLSSVRPRAHCADCDIDYEVDFAENVEAVFNVSAAIRDVQPRVYCAGSPVFRPHMLAVLQLPPRGRREIDCVLPGGLLLARANQRRGAIAVDDPPGALEVRLGGREVTLTLRPRSADAKTTRVTVINETDEALPVSLERAGWNADIVLGSVILTMPEFHDLFSTEAPATGCELSVGALTVLFSDLTGTTALYDQLGDAKAFALVQEHFATVGEVVARQDGAIVKTMGDAVMATFHSPARALEAAAEMTRRVAEVAQRHRLDGLGIKIGLHEGPCLVVRANDRLDFFGTTVNVASRMQHQARAGEVVMSADLMAHPEVEKVVRGSHRPVEMFRAELKGVRGAQSLLRIRGA